MPHHHDHHHQHGHHENRHEEHHEPPPHVDYIAPGPGVYPPPGGYGYPPQGPPPMGYPPAGYPPGPMHGQPGVPGYHVDPSIGSAGMIQPNIHYNPGVPGAPPIGSAGMVEHIPSNVGHANEGQEHHKHGIMHKLFHKKHDH